MIPTISSTVMFLWNSCVSSYEPIPVPHRKHMDMPNPSSPLPSNVARKRTGIRTHGPDIRSRADTVVQTSKTQQFDLMPVEEIMMDTDKNEQ